MELAGKKINFLGDSITEGHGTSSKDKIYLNLIKEKYNLSCARNYGISGTRIARQTNPSAEPRFDLDFCRRADEMEDDADVVVVFGGTNDYGHGDAPLGTFDDRCDNTFYGACHVLFEKLIKKYPEAEIVVMTPLHRVDENNMRGDCEKAYNVAKLETYVDIIKEVAKYYALPVLDLYSVSGIQPNVEFIKEKYAPDGLHPNDDGHVKIAKRLAAFLKAL